MDCINKVHENDDKPEVYCALSLFFDDNTNIAVICEKMYALGIEEIREIHPKCESGIVLEIAILEYERFWEIDHALSKMFSTVDVHLPEIRELVEAYHGKIYIDIAIIEHGTYPAMLFAGENMRKIHDLRAQISIDLL